MDLLLATTNPGKIAEMRLLVAGTGVNVRSLSELGIHSVFSEGGNSFEENAKTKALYYSRLCVLPTVAEDSGLVVDALHGRPGVYSARYAGPRSPSEENIARLLHEMKDVSDRRAAFVSVIALSWQGELLKTFCGEAAGEITRDRHGSGGFGYDPVFYFPPLAKTFAEISVEDKNRFSHRAQAVGQLISYLREKKFFP